MLADCLTEAIDCANGLRPPYKVVKNDVVPPLPFARASVETCYAFSVFSHLSEKAARNWITHLGEVLVDGGKLFITTRGPRQIEAVRSARSQVSLIKGILKRKILRRNDHSTKLQTLLPHPDKVKELLEQGMFQWYPTGGGGELSDDFYGEAWIPKKWMQENHTSLGFRCYEFFPETGAINQCIFVLTK